ncbi:alpha amylase C-terminal domain-containing protein [Verrucomicrobiaceae bacterium N1E253]|uniref:1,4-alpha-glucan branching enzyme n=1 Tax=Oceaniferula marina TaxID=2748318 RepID=A0A851GPY2_9BACT|nr:alpha-amylase family glycosyl hydrolase [Oceaniferula marina]NWK57057.1 alpha amylase C-terminal domain-containing protein [Oceaniferula marina]
MSKSIPTLVANDPWLEPYTDHIRWRMQQLDERLQSIQQQAGSLENYASRHLNHGIHLNGDQSAWIIREWAPAAHSVSLVGDFNQWNPEATPLSRDQQGGWQTELPKKLIKHKELIKLHIVGADGSVRDRIPATILRCVQDSKTHDYSGQVWSPETAYTWKHSFDPATIKAPTIYEAHVGMAGEAPRLHSYREFAEQVLPRIAELGYNTIQLMAVQEHPYYGSFGYHVSSFFAPCSRFGTPDELKYLIDTAHGLGIAVLLDIVHSHAVKNIAEGLNDFDGSGNQYFHAGDRGNQPQWDSKCFDYGKSEVQQFLLSNVRYWLEEFHFDGFRFDGITSMLYHHHGTVAFDHYDKYFLDGPDEDAILYLGLATTLAKQIQPGALLIAEDMSGMPGLCRPAKEGGVGFTHRLAMGIPDYWIKLLKHKQDEDWKPEEMWGVMTNRRYGEANIAYAESHDQALVGDKTIAFRLMDQDMYWHMSIDDQHGGIERGIALHKLIRLFTLVSGGEGWLNFMGNEFGHPEWLDFPREGNDWSYHYCRRQWSLVDNPELRYQYLNAFDGSMMNLTEKYQLLQSPPAKLLYVHNDDQILAAERAGLIFVFNFNPHQSFPDYLIPVDDEGPYKIVLNSDSAAHGGHRRIDPSIIPQTNAETQLPLYIPSRCCLVLKKWE